MSKMTVLDVQNDLDTIYGTGVFSLLDDDYKGNHKKNRIRYNKTGEIFFRSKVDMDRGQNLRGAKKVLLLDRSNKVLTPEQQADFNSYNNKAQRQTSDEYYNKFYTRWGNRFTLLTPYTGYKNKIKVRCNNCNSVFERNSAYLYSQGKCNYCTSLSLPEGESLLYSMFDKTGLNFEYQKRITVYDNKHKVRYLRNDFTFEEPLKLVVEFDGSQHYDVRTKYYSKEAVYRDTLKNDWAKNNGYKMIRIRDFDKDTIINSLEPYLGKLVFPDSFYSKGFRIPILDIRLYLKKHTIRETSKKFNLPYQQISRISGEFSDNKRGTIKYPRIKNSDESAMIDDYQRRLNERYGVGVYKVLKYFAGIKGVRSARVTVTHSRCNTTNTLVAYNLLRATNRYQGCSYCSGRKMTVKRINSDLFKVYKGRYWVLTKEYVNNEGLLKLVCSNCKKKFVKSYKELKQGHCCPCGNGVSNQAGFNRTMFKKYYGSSKR